MNNRREFLKRIGIGAAGAAVAVSTGALSPWLKMGTAAQPTSEDAWVVGPYPVGHGKDMVLGFPHGKPPRLGQRITFGTGAESQVYTIIERNIIGGTQYSILLDRPLELGIQDGTPGYLGHEYQDATWDKDYSAVVVKPRDIREWISTPGSSIAMRVTMDHREDLGGSLVTMDLLCGVAILDTDLKTVMLN